MCSSLCQKCNKDSKYENLTWETHRYWSHSCDAKIVRPFLPCPNSDNGAFQFQYKATIFCKKRLRLKYLGVSIWNCVLHLILFSPHPPPPSATKKILNSCVKFSVIILNGIAKLFFIIYQCVYHKPFVKLSGKAFWKIV